MVPRTAFVQFAAPPAPAPATTTTSTVIINNAIPMQPIQPPEQHIHYHYGNNNNFGHVSGHNVNFGNNASAGHGSNAPSNPTGYMYDSSSQASLAGKPPPPPYY
mgnify:CR=1 FL=1